MSAAELAREDRTFARKSIVQALRDLSRDGRSVHRLFDALDLLLQSNPQHPY
jgi:hypothetical protein